MALQQEVADCLSCTADRQQRLPPTFKGHMSTMFPVGVSSSGRNSLTYSPLLLRHVERHHQGGHQDPEAGHHVPGGLPAGGPDHEEAAARQAGAAVRRGLRGAHLHRDRVHGQR